MLEKALADLLRIGELLFGDVLHLVCANFVRKVRQRRVFCLFNIFNVNWPDVFLAKCFLRKFSLVVRLSYLAFLERQVRRILRLRGSFRDLYRAHQRDEEMTSGARGPISILEPGREFLFLAFAASRRPRVEFPPGWRLARIATFLYGVGALLSDGLVGASAQISAKRTVDYLLCIRALPPLSLPVLQLPSQVAVRVPIE